MKTNRRKFISTAVAGGLGTATLPLASCASEVKASDINSELQSRYSKLDEILKQPVLLTEDFKSPIIIDSLDLLLLDRSFLCRVRSKDGAEGISVAHSGMSTQFPFFLRNLKPFFIGQDVRELDLIMEKVMNYNFNFRYNGMTLGIPLATIEFAILDMLGRIANKPIGQLFGKIYNTHVPVYRATEFRELPIDEHFAKIVESVSSYDLKAFKLKVGYMFSGTKDIHYAGIPGKSEKLIPMLRNHFGDEWSIYSDSNGYYDVEGAIKIGKILEENKFMYFEEPVRYDWLDGTKQVADALNIPVSGGEQQHDYPEFRWLIANDGLDIVQPNQYYFGGIIRSLKVARMADAFGKKCIPHLSGGFGYIYMMHFVSAIPNAGPHIEFKGYSDLPLECKSSSLKVENGKIEVPTGPGVGVEIDPDYIKKHKIITNWTLT